MKRTEKQSIFHLMHHFIIGGVLTVKGYDKFGHHPVLGSIIFLFGIIILSYCFWVVFRSGHSSTLPILFHLFDGLVLLFTAYIFFMEGKKYLPYASLLASIGFFISVYVLYNQHKNNASSALDT